jgi:hypothetical protein
VLHHYDKLLRIEYYSVDKGKIGFFKGGEKFFYKDNKIILCKAKTKNHETFEDISIQNIPDQCMDNLWYELNSKGQLETSIIEYENKENNIRGKLKYTDNNQLIEKVVYHKCYPPLECIEQYRFSYEDNKIKNIFYRLISEIKIEEDKGEFWYTYTYDRQFNLKKIEGFKKINGVIKLMHLYEYDFYSNGTTKNIKHTDYDVDKPTSSFRAFSYNDREKQIIESQFDFEGKKKIIVIYTYDKFNEGRKVRSGILNGFVDF